MTRPNVCFAILLVLAVCLCTGCGRAVPLDTTTPVMLAAPQDPAAVRAALVRALDARELTHEEPQPGRIVAHFRHRGVGLDLGIEYDGTGYRMHYLGSTGLDHQVDEQGNAMISRKYYAYLERLQRTISDELERPERERREAIEQQREHELALAREQREREEAAIEAQAAERERERQVTLERERIVNERERLRVARARADADARRPVIVQTTAEPSPVIVRTARARRATRELHIPLGSERMLDGRAGGRLASVDMGFPSSCQGFYDDAPQHVIYLDTWHDALRFETEAGGDVTLALVDAQGTTWCDDDSAGGRDALIAGRFAPGSYRVFVGAFERGSRIGYRLYVGDRAAQAVVAVAQQPAPAPPPPDCRQTLLDRGHAPAHLGHCAGAEPRCAAALLSAGHHPAHLMHCRGVEPSCAESLLRNGQHPAHLMHCRP